MVDNLGSDLTFYSKIHPILSLGMKLINDLKNITSSKADLATIKKQHKGRKTEISGITKGRMKTVRKTYAKDCRIYGKFLQRSQCST